MKVLFNPTDYVIEPANIHTLEYVTSINLANTPRLHVRNPIGCGDDEIEVFPSNYAVVNKEGIVGDVELVEGWNCSINTRDNGIKVDAVKGGGKSIYETQPGEVAVTSEECEVERCGAYLSGGEKCIDLIGSINGLRGPAIAISGGFGVSVTPSENTLEIKLITTSGTDDCEVPECVVKAIDKYVKIPYSSEKK